uniref:Calcium voltage-gated channel auxiliary subunit alpha2delta 1 n=1 Tax=Astyanax mexicanus TaxID=7994 RepID=A0A8B9R5W4_ASTMX
MYFRSYFTSFTELFLLQLDANETQEGRIHRIRPDFKEDPSFKNRLISYNHSAVHIPTDIYDGSTIVLNELNWTEALEDVFKKNREEDPTLLWQVFGSATGLARYYPASPWKDARKTPSKIDLYDVRRRPWYVQGAASPKDMLILVDASGSVSGLTLKLIRTSVSEMLETLSDDDYVNVVNFNTRVNNTACFDHLVQANVRNKKILKDGVQNITAKGITNYTKGFEFAFKQLSDPNVTRANCNKIIMLFTDGGEERAQEIFSRYNPEKKVRIFTFSVGQHNYDTGPIQWMACANKGYFYEIPSIGAIRINTQEYLDVLGRPMVLADAKQVQWTNVYLDALELGLVITGTLPVFNKTSSEDGSRKQLILGVMGVDVSLDDIKRLTPRFTIGPNGYYFAIDPNGYVLLHPNLQPKVRVCLYFTVHIRTMMIDRVPGNKTIDTLVKTQDERYIDRGVRTYTWAPVNGTDYRSAAFSCTCLIMVFLCKFEENGYTFIAPREYCQDLKITSNNTQFLMDFNQYIDKRTPSDPMCKYIQYIILPFNLIIKNVKGVLARFVATDGGITRVYPKSGGEEWTENAETFDSSFYKRSLDNDIYIFTAPYLNSKPPVHMFYLVYSSTRKCVCVCHVDCVILDDGGFLLMSNQEEYITQVRGLTLTPELHSSLSKRICRDAEEDDVVDGKQFFSLFFPLKMTCILYFSLTSIEISFPYLVLLTKYTFVGFFSAYSEEDTSDAYSKESCITEQTQYFFENDNRSFQGVLDCGNCSRMYRAEKLPSTNLVFLITDAKSTCLSCDPKPLKQAEQPSIGPDPCMLAQNPRYRKGPDVCFDNNDDVMLLLFSYEYSFTALMSLYVQSVHLLPWLQHRSSFCCCFSFVFDDGQFHFAFIVDQLV